MFCIFRKSKLPCSGLLKCLLCENNEVIEDISGEDISDEYTESKDSEVSKNQIYYKIIVM